MANCWGRSVKSIDYLCNLLIVSVNVLKVRDRFTRQKPSLTIDKEFTPDFILSSIWFTNLNHVLHS